ncbi:DnaD domain-containing protein [Brevibacillus dissolubilis]|uniref:DnaD domain-containing protein n=1 Tax=Brevibacillus dissolubilis TaxID=1844116 RepID=UPI00210034E6|nr:DnaD domain protein [Brevibacillus dissolubilis]
MDRQILQLLQEGATSVSNLLIKKYKRMGLTDEEMMLIIHLLSFQQEGNRFPALHELEERLSMPSLRLIQLLQKLLKDEWISIDESVDPNSGMRSESYNLEYLYQKLYQCWKKEQMLQKEAIADARAEVAAASGQYEASGHYAPMYDTPKVTTPGTGNQAFTPGHPPVAPRTANGHTAPSHDDAELGLYSQFEQAFGRPLSPIEVETIQIWVEQDKYADDLIVCALREAVSVGKLYIRYIDRILLEWQRQQITNVEEARNYSLRFRRQSMARESR